MLGFNRKVSSDALSNMRAVINKFSPEEQHRQETLKNYWNFYEGYHWENLPENEGAEITINYCRAFVDKYVSFELGKAFTITTKSDLSSLIVTNDGRTLFEFLEDVWEDNDQYTLIVEIGQMKSITGDAWVQVRFNTPEELEGSDIFNEYPEGRIKLNLFDTSKIFPEYDPHNRGVLTKLTISYTYEKEVQKVFGGSKKETVLYKQVWTKDSVVVEDGEEKEEYPNKYGVIPFIQIKNLTVAGKNEGRSDLEDVIPLNTEYNLKRSNVSEILDYHASPITAVFGAKIGNLEKGAGKLWGGLAKDARIENLELKSDLGASQKHIADMRVAMCEVGGIPENMLGGSQAISNTSGVALQYVNLPLIEKTRIKRMVTETALERLNKLIILVGVLEGLVKKPEDISTRDFFWNEVKIPDTLPKDTLLELQQIQQEMKLGLESRRNAMKRMDKENIEDLIEEIDEDMRENPHIYSINQKEEDPKINSGFMNGQTTLETLRKEITGSNGIPNQ